MRKQKIKPEDKQPIIQSIHRPRSLAYQKLTYGEMETERDSALLEVQRYVKEVSKLTDELDDANAEIARLQSLTPAE